MKAKRDVSATSYRTSESEQCKRPRNRVVSAEGHYFGCTTRRRRASGTPVSAFAAAAFVHFGSWALGLGTLSAWEGRERARGALVTAATASVQLGRGGEGGVRGAKA